MGFTFIVLVMVVFGDEVTAKPVAAPAEARKPRVERALSPRRRVRRLESYRILPPLRTPSAFSRPVRYQSRNTDSAKSQSETPAPHFQSNRSKYIPADPKTLPYWIAGLVAFIVAGLFFGRRR